MGRSSVPRLFGPLGFASLTLASILALPAALTIIAFAQNVNTLTKTIYSSTMIFDAHFLLYSKAPDADRAFFQDVLGLHSVDAGDGWLIFATPPSELGIHPTELAFSEGHAGHTLQGAVLYLLCDDLEHTISFLNSKGIRVLNESRRGGGAVTTVPLAEAESDSTNRDISWR